MTTPAAPGDILTILRHSHDRLAAAVTPLTDEQLSGPAYPSEWSIAQVLSHLGSGAEIFTLLFQSALTGAAPPEQADYQQIWDVWNARSPRDEADHGLAADASMLDQVGAMTDAQRAAFGVEMFNGHQDLAGFLLTRLSEHAIHVWDIVVVADPTAALAEDATALLLDRLSDILGYAGKPSATDLDVVVSTSTPERRFQLQLRSTGVTRSDAPTGTGARASLRLPAEALIRLVYGRLDPEHTPSAVQADGVELDQLRTALPGF